MKGAKKMKGKKKISLWVGIVAFVLMGLYPFVKCLNGCAKISWY